MTATGKWLGRDNGFAMVADLLTEHISKEQALSVVTTYCLMFGIEVDTNEWDILIEELFNHYNEWFDTLFEMDDYMAQFLV